MRVIPRESGGVKGNLAWSELLIDVWKGKISDSESGVCRRTLLIGRCNKDVVGAGKWEVGGVTKRYIRLRVRCEEEDVWEVR